MRLQIGAGLVEGLVSVRKKLDFSTGQDGQEAGCHARSKPLAGIQQRIFPRGPFSGYDRWA